MSPELFQFGVLFVGTGAFAGLMSGLLGIGGGLILVPMLAIIFAHRPDIPQDLVMHMAAGSTLGSMIFSSAVSVRAHSVRGGILWGVYRSILPGVMVGLVAGALLADYLPTQVLKIIFGIFLLLVAVKMMWRTSLGKGQKFPKRWIHRGVSFVIGLKSGLLGIGGGAVLIPYLTYCGVELRKTAGVSSACSLTAALIGTFLYSVTGSNEAGLPFLSTGYVYWPASLTVALLSSLFAPIGARLTYAMPVNQLKAAFVVFLLATAVHLLL